MTPIEIKKKKIEMQRIDLAKQDLEIRIAEMLEEVERLKKHVETQELAIQKIKDEFNF